MATAKGRVLTVVRGKIDNTTPHYAFVRNGRQYIGCCRNGWNTELTTDTQKITALNFAYATAIATMLHAVYKAGTSQQLTRSISYNFQHVKVGRRQYFFDETLFEQVNDILKRYLHTVTDFFTISGTWTDDAEYDHDIYTPKESARKTLDATGKTAFRYQFASILMNNADTLNLPAIYDELSQCTGADFNEDDVYPLADVYEVYNLLRLDLWRWAKIPVMQIIPENYDELLRLNKQGFDHRADFPAYIAEQAWRTS